MQTLLTAVISVAFLLLFVATIVVLCWHDDGRGHSMDWHRRNGTHRVIYSDGQRSQPMSRQVAKDYASMFDGRVERV